MAAGGNADEVHPIGAGDVNGLAVGLHETARDDHRTIGFDNAVHHGAFNVGLRKRGPCRHGNAARQRGRKNDLLQHWLTPLFRPTWPVLTWRERASPLADFAWFGNGAGGDSFAPTAVKKSA